jgi:hypothetical protein
MTLPVGDHLAILNLISAYNHAIDFGSPDEYADCFTVDGEFDARPVVDAHGRGDLLEFATLVAANGRRSWHWTSNVWVDGDSTEARAKVYLVNMSTGLNVRSGPTGVYHDRLVKTAEGWRFRHRKLVFDEPPPWPPARED